MFIKSLAFFTALSFTTSVTAIQNLVLDPNPQSTSNTCQSYSIAFTLAQSGLWHTEVTTPKQLRALEQNIRKEINQYVAERQADGKSISTYHHTAWAAAVKRASSNNLKLKLYYPNNPDDYYKKIAQITNMTSASTMGSALSALLVKQPIMTSVNQLNNDIYASGHIVTILGLGSSLPTNQTISAMSEKMLVLNSAIKTNDKVFNMCSDEITSGDEQYNASVSLSSSYTAKKWSGKHLLMWIERNR